MEDCDGDMWCFNEISESFWCAISSGPGYPDLEEMTPSESNAAPGHDLTFHPPREHWAAEVERLAGEVDDWVFNMDLVSCEAILRLTADLRALFRAAPEVDGE